MTGFKLSLTLTCFPKLRGALVTCVHVICNHRGLILALHGYASIFKMGPGDNHPTKEKSGTDQMWIKCDQILKT